MLLRKNLMWRYNVMSGNNVILGSGNIYKDLGFKNHEEMQAKAMLASFIISIINKKKWSQEEAALKLGITQPKISLLSHGQFSGFSLGKLINLLNRLNQDVDIVVKTKPVSTKHHVGHVNVIYA